MCRAQRDLPSAPHIARTLRCVGLVCRHWRLNGLRLHPSVESRAGPTHPQEARTFPSIPGLRENGSGQPWVDDRYREIFKVDQIASGQGGVARRHDTSDHCVAQFNWPALALPGGHEVGGLGCSFIIEWSHSMTHFLEKSLKRL